MYIKAIVKDRQNNLHIVEAKHKIREAALLIFATRFRRFANQNYALVEIHTDDGLIAKKLMDEGHYVVFNPYPEEESKHEK